MNNWYIDVLEPPRSYRIDIGYLVEARAVLRPGPVECRDHAQGRGDRPRSTRTGSTSRSSSSGSRPGLVGGGTNGIIGEYAIDLRDLFEERLRRPMCSLALQNLATAALPSLGRDFHFEIDAELIVYGTTEPNAKVTLQGEPVQLRPDGTFTVRFSLPDSRQIIPAVAASPDGVEERTIVLAVERNTKELEPMIHDGNEL